jgi:hypothetical protein
MPILPLSNSYIVQASIHSNWVVGMAAFPTSSGIVLNNDDYEALKSKIQPENLGKFSVINLKTGEKPEVLLLHLIIALKLIITFYQSQTVKISNI